jgi:hypothetical protein
MKCARCRIEFTPKRINQRFCSGECRYKRWVELNRERLNYAVRRYRARRYKEEGRWLDEGQKARALKKFMIEIKSKPCIDCGGTFPVCCMDFAHRDPKDKKYNLGSMFSHHYGRELIEKELEKCDLVCANCHRVRTQKEKTGNGRNKKTV